MERNLFLLLAVLVLTLYSMPETAGGGINTDIDPSAPEGFVEVLADGAGTVYPLNDSAVQELHDRGIDIQNGDLLFLEKGSVTGKGRMAGGKLIVLGLPVNVNEASVYDLEAVRGIGKKTAEAIVDHRERSGNFKSLNELTDIAGIGKKKLDKMMAYISL